ncbi:MAG: dipeptidase [SAR202 cluster bacterium]|jgi:membrane dipeptidase|nr:dipeptidase [SAR202 cluster bacterium]MDP6514954.1 dipeptidase [SAR202 cluster bacterium]MDP6714844.1 dipeptidase [SAR202 cluster bacterium]
MTTYSDSEIQRARALHDKIPLIDGHNDLPWQYRKVADNALSKIDISQNQPGLHTDIPRLREGGVGGQFWSVYIPQALPQGEHVRATMEQIDVVYNMLRQWPDAFQLSLTADDVEAAFDSGKIGSLIGIEGGHSIDNSLGALRMFHRLGARYMTLTHFQNVDWADSCTDEPKVDGLSEFGREVVREMNRLGMLVDLSHVHADTMRATLDTSDAPVVFSHSSARAITGHPRNVPDDVLERVKENDGVVMVSFVPGFVSQQTYEHGLARDAEKARLEALPDSSDESVDAGLQAWDAENSEPRATVSDIADHIDRIREKAGIDHIGIGSDYDGITSVPEGLEDVSKYPVLTAELLRREYSEEDILKILGGNILRLMRAVEGAASRIQQERGPSEALIEELDGHADSV